MKMLILSHFLCYQDDHGDAIIMMTQNVQGNHEFGFDSLPIIENNACSTMDEKDAALLAVFVSDEDDSSIPEFLLCLYLKIG